MCLWHYRVNPVDGLCIPVKATPQMQTNCNDAAGTSKCGPRYGNTNALRNGTRIERLTLGDLPDRMRRHLATARHYRRTLEQLVLATKGEVSLIDAHWIDEAASAEIHSGICRWL